MPATYDETQLETVPLFAARLFAADTDVTKAVWSDAEFLYFLTRTGQVPELAAARALRTAAVNKAKLAKIVQIGTYKVDRRELPALLRQMAADLEATVAVGGLLAAPDLVFTLTEDDGATPGTMDVW